MSILRARSQGGWIDTSRGGYARVGGQWEFFGPDTGGDSYESISWPNEPTLTNANDGAGSVYTMGIKFHLIEPKLCLGVRWRVPDSVIDPPGGHVVSLWYRVNEQLVIPSKGFTPTPGQYQNIMFDEPVLLDANPVEYVASVHTWSYVYSNPTPGTDWLVTSPSGNIRGDAGRLSASSTPTFPASTFNAWYYVSPIIEV